MASSQAAMPARAVGRRLTGWFMAGTVLLLGAAVVAAVYASSATAASRAEFWTVAVPGLATGTGTLVLALATVWVSGAARIDRELERLAAEELDAAREARKVVAILHEQSSGTTLSIANAGREPILDVVTFQPQTEPDQNGVTYQWAADPPERDWPGAWWIEHSLRALFVPAGGQFSIAGNLYRIDVEKCCSAAQAGAGKRLEHELRIAWTDATGRHWQRFGQEEPAAVVGAQLQSRHENAEHARHRNRLQGVAEPAHADFPVGGVAGCHLVQRQEAPTPATSGPSRTSSMPVPAAASSTTTRTQSRPTCSMRNA
jgi:hypothetical protein